MPTLYVQITCQHCPHRIVITPEHYRHRLTRNEPHSRARRRPARARLYCAQCGARWPEVDIISSGLPRTDLGMLG